MHIHGYLRARARTRARCCVRALVALSPSLSFVLSPSFSRSTRTLGVAGVLPRRAQTSRRHMHGNALYTCNSAGECELVHRVCYVE